MSILGTVLTLSILVVKLVLASGPDGGGPGQQAVGAAPGRLVQGSRHETSHPGLVRYSHQMLVQGLLECILAPSYLSDRLWQGVEETSSINCEALFPEGLDGPPPPGRSWGTLHLLPILRYWPLVCSSHEHSSKNSPGHKDI